MGNVIRLEKFKLAWENKQDLEIYESKISKMQKAELLCELLEFHQLIKEKKLDLSITQKGMSLMEILKDRSLTPALRELADKYHVQLKNHYDRIMLS